MATHTGDLRLVGDIGGTRARFALFRPGRRLERIEIVRTRECGSLAEAVEDYLSQLADAPAPSALASAVFAVAGPVIGDRVELTNCPFAISIEETRRALGLERLAVVNDVHALAAAVPHMKDDDLTRIGGGSAAADAPRAVIAPGTGLGMSALVPCGARLLPMPSEGGHVTFAPGDETERELADALGRELDHVSAERLVSGPGLLSIYGRLCAARGEAALADQPEDVTQRVIAGYDPVAREAVRLFTGMLAGVAADLVLTLGARGGLYIGGGIARDLGSDFDAGLFMERFTNKGRMRAYLAEVPVHVVRHRYPVLLGAANFEIA